MEFKIGMLDGYSIIEEPCTAIIKVANNTGALYTKDSHNRWIINLRAVTKDNLEILINIDNSMTEYEYSSVGHLMLTGAIWENQVDDEIKLPTKGESIIATFDYIDKILRCTNLTIIPRHSPKVFKASSLIKEAMNEFTELIKSIK